MNKNASDELALSIASSILRDHLSPTFFSQAEVCSACAIPNSPSHPLNMKAQMLLLIAMLDNAFIQPESDWR